MRALAALTLWVAAGVQGGDAGRACTDVGGFDGIAVEIPRSLFVRSGSLVFEVCDAHGCASATRRLGRVPEGPVGRAAAVTFDDLGRDFAPGLVAVTVQLPAPEVPMSAVGAASTSVAAAGASRHAHRHERSLGSRQERVSGNGTDRARASSEWPRGGCDEGLGRSDPVGRSWRSRVRYWTRMY